MGSSAVGLPQSRALEGQWLCSRALPRGHDEMFAVAESWSSCGEWRGRFPLRLGRYPCLQLRLQCSWPLIQNKSNLKKGEGSSQMLSLRNSGCLGLFLWDASFSIDWLHNSVSGDIKGEGGVGHRERAGTKLPAGAWERAAQGRDGSGPTPGLVLRSAGRRHDLGRALTRSPVPALGAPRASAGAGGAWLPTRDWLGSRLPAATGIGSRASAGDLPVPGHPVKPRRRGTLEGLSVSGGFWRSYSWPALRWFCRCLRSFFPVYTVRTGTSGWGGWGGVHGMLLGFVAPRGPSLVQMLSPARCSGSKCGSG